MAEDLKDHRRYLAAHSSKVRPNCKNVGVELGIWQDSYHNMELPWLRCWDLQGNLLLTGEEKAERLTAQLRALGIEPEA
ncbi:hypothetical protein BDGGKGIB_03966 [Nodularia sphaerocarpa UHCC 0038]|nr:hypothetical protein BDGGKGIB_03966 [Nodularia sphaerocarpa UHCC 0038]